MPQTTRLEKMNRYAEKNNYYGLSAEEINAMRKVLVDGMKKETGFYCNECHSMVPDSDKTKKEVFCPACGERYV